MDLQEIATKSDIQDVLFAIDQLRSFLTSQKSEQKYLRSADVRQMLNISDSTLQRLRINNTIPSVKINGTWFYKYEDVGNMMKGGLK